MRAISTRASLLLGVLALSACSDSSDSTEPCVVSSVTVSPSTLTIAPGSSAPLAVTYSSSGCTLRLETTWQSTNTSIATVTPAGAVFAVAPGVATLTAIIGGVSGSAVVTVISPTVSTVVVTLPSASMTAGTTQQATAVLRDANNQVVTGRSVAWTSSAPAIAQVDGATGVITAVSPGAATITATSDGRAGTVQVTVLQVPVATVAVSVPSVSMAAGSTQQAVVQLRDAANVLLTGRTVTWSSSATAVATVNPSTGLITAVADGNAIISATVEGKVGTVTITVAPPAINTIVVSVSSASMFAGAMQVATAVLRDANNQVITGRAVNWTSSSAAVATVNATSGLITAVAAGTTNIVASAEGKLGTVSVTVLLVPVATITVTPLRASMATGTSQAVTAVLRDSILQVLTDRTVTWSSSNPAVASVNANGLVTAITAGTTNIIAAVDGKTGSTTITSVQVPTMTSVSPTAIDAVFSSVLVTMTGANVPADFDVAFSAPIGASVASFAATSNTTVTGTLTLASAGVNGLLQMGFQSQNVYSDFRTATIYPATTAPLQITATLGGGGGAPFGAVDCPAGTFATGLNGRSSDNVDQLSLKCQSITGASRAFGSVQFSATAGPNTGAAFSLPCSANQVMVGISARVAFNGTAWFTAAAAICAPLAIGSTVTTSFAGGAEAGTATGVVMCPAGLALVGFEGNSGQFVDSVRLRCR